MVLVVILVVASEKYELGGDTKTCAVLEMVSSLIWVKVLSYVLRVVHFIACALYPAVD